MPETIQNNSSGVTSDKENDQLEISDRYKKFKEDGRIVFITFHPAYSYEEFIEGISVDISQECVGEIKYKLKTGIFKEICRRALGAALGMAPEKMEGKTWKDVFQLFRESPESVEFSNAPKYVLIIDEINRGDIAKIFGELITLLEADKRLGAENELTATLPTSGDEFGVPGNLFIIGTMNTADRSIAMLDIALRRRFGFVEMNPDFDILEKEHLERNIEVLKDNQVYELLQKAISAARLVNKKICMDPAIGRDRQIGHSFFFKVKTIDDLVMVWRHEIFPLLEEYCYSDYMKINKILFDSDSDTEWISVERGILELDKENISKMVDSIK